MKIKAFIFDMDGVITSSSDEHFIAWKKIIEKYCEGMELDDAVEVYTRGVSRMESLEVCLKAVGCEDRFTKSEKEAIATEKNDVYKALISEFDPSHVLPGIRELLVELKENNLKIALASASKNGPLLLEKLEIKDFFDYVVDPTTVPGKPKPDIFLAAASHLGFKPEGCVGVEDAVSGVQAIKSANMFAVGIGSKELLNQADIVYDDTSELSLVTILEQV